MHRLASSCLPSLSAAQYIMPSEKALVQDRILASSSACSNNKLSVNNKLSGDDDVVVIVYSLSLPQVIEESVSVSYPLNLFFPSKLKSRHDVSSSSAYYHGSRRSTTRLLLLAAQSKDPPGKPNTHPSFVLVHPWRAFLFLGLPGYLKRLRPLLLFFYFCTPNTIQTLTSRSLFYN